MFPKNETNGGFRKIFENYKKMPFIFFCLSFSNSPSSLVVGCDETRGEQIIIMSNLLSPPVKKCRRLLTAVIEHWEALKGASIEAVQNTFLLREGKVTKKEGQWLVQVERTGVDILLEKLPWNYSILKLPWLNELIYTEW